MRRRRALTVIASTTALLVGGATGGLADGKDCWGTVTAQAAREGGMGQHASEQSEPRSGLGNLSRELDFDHISEMGAFLATVDGIDATSCDAG
jgi:hypothetical protein